MCDPPKQKPFFPSPPCMSGSLVELARWRRRQGRHVLVPGMPVSTEPRAKLYALSKTLEGRAFIEQRVAELRARVSMAHGSREVQDLEDAAQDVLLLGLFLEKLGPEHCEEALTQVELAVDMDGGEAGADSFMLTERARLRTVVSTARQEHALLQQLNALPPLSLTPPPSPPGKAEKARGLRAVDVVDSDVLSVEQFHRLYAEPGVPCIIRGGASVCFNVQQQQQQQQQQEEGGAGRCERVAWRQEVLRLLRTKLGDKKVTVKRHVRDSMSWAKLEDRTEGEGGEVTVGDLLDRVHTETHDANGNLVEPHESLQTLGEGETGAPHEQGTSGEGSSRGAGERVRGRKRSRAPEGGGYANDEAWYLHDWSLAQHCPELLAQSFSIPKWFAGDLLQRAKNWRGKEVHQGEERKREEGAGADGGGGSEPPGSERCVVPPPSALCYADSWPSLFIGSKASKSDTHVDSFGSHFWMALLRGRKRWIMYPKEAVPLLHPRYVEGSLVASFPPCRFDTASSPGGAAVDGEGAGKGLGYYDPCAVGHPEHVQWGWECVLEEGDLLFVPSGSAHAVLNLTPTVAISANYVDTSNLDLCLSALAQEAYSEEPKKRLRETLLQVRDRLKTNERDNEKQEEQTHVPWLAFKASKLQ